MIDSPPPGQRLTRPLYLLHDFRANGMVTWTTSCTPCCLPGVDIGSSGRRASSADATNCAKSRIVRAGLGAARQLVAVNDRSDNPPAQSRPEPASRPAYVCRCRGPRDHWRVVNQSIGPLDAFARTVSTPSLFEGGVDDACAGPYGGSRPPTGLPPPGSRSASTPRPRHDEQKYSRTDRAVSKTLDLSTSDRPPESLRVLAYARSPGPSIRAPLRARSRRPARLNLPLLTPPDRLAVDSPRHPPSPPVPLVPHPPRKKHRRGRSASLLRH